MTKWKHCLCFCPVCGTMSLVTCWCLENGFSSWKFSAHFSPFALSPPLNSSIGSKLPFLLLFRSFKPVDQWADRTATKRVGKKFTKKKNQELKILTNLDYTWQKPEVACELSISWKAGIDQCHCIEDNGGLSAKKLAKWTERKWSFLGKSLTTSLTPFWKLLSTAFSGKLWLGNILSVGE